MSGELLISAARRFFGIVQGHGDLSSAGRAGWRGAVDAGFCGAAGTEERGTDGVLPSYTWPMASTLLYLVRHGMWAGIRGYHAEPKFPAVLTDDELRAISGPVLLVTGARSSLLTPAEARARGGLMPQAEVTIVPGSHGGFNRIDELNNRITAFIQAHATGRHAVQPTRPSATER